MRNCVNRLHARVVGGILTLLATLLAATVFAPPAQAAPVYYLVINVQSGRCLDAEMSAPSSNGNPVRLMDCNRTTPQQWYWEGEKLRNRGSIGDRCLDADSGSINRNGTKIHLWDCHSGNNQRWVGFGSLDRVELWNRGGRRCLDADSGTIGGNNTRVQLWDCHGGNNQRWQLARL